MIASLVLSRWNNVAVWSLKNEPKDADEYEDFLTWDSKDSAPTWGELQALWPEVQAKIAAEKQARIDAKASAIAKLEALGLTVDEVQVAFGLNANG
jgi:uncharacterized protein with GYD domain